MIGSQRAILLVLADAIGIFCWVAERAFVEIGCAPAADVEHDQANGATDRGICSVARPESIGTSIHANCARNWTVDDYQRGSHVGRGLHAIEVERSARQRLHGGAYNWGVFRLAAGHDHIDGQDLPSECPPARSNFALDKFWISAKDLHDGIDLIPRGRDHRQAVSPTSLEVDLD